MMNSLTPNLFDSFFPKESQNLPYAACYNSYKFGCNLSICLSVAVVYVSLFGFSRALEHVR